MIKEETKDLEILKLQKVDCLVKCLGTMVMVPQYETDVLDLSAKPKFLGTIQQPILMGELREKTLKVLEKIVETI